MVAAIRQTTGYSCIPTVTGRSIANRSTWHNRVPHGAFERLERHAGKLARAVLRGLGGSNPARLPGAIFMVAERSGRGDRICYSWHPKNQVIFSVIVMLVTVTGDEVVYRHGRSTGHSRTQTSHRGPIRGRRHDRGLPVIYSRRAGWSDSHLSLMFVEEAEHG
jgi:hypothetical protein